MPSENAEAFRRGLEAFNERDVDALIALTSPEVEWYPAFAALAMRDVYRGHEGIRELFRETDEAFSHIHSEATEVRDLGDRVVALGHFSAVGSVSGIETESPSGWIAEIEDGKVRRLRTFISHEDTLRAAGIQAS
jgi:ketosteroid isomerase-like protein